MIIHKALDWNRFRPSGDSPMTRFFEEKDTTAMLEIFTEKENMDISYKPLVIATIAWIYADKIVKYCRANKIQEVKELSSTISMLHQEYKNFLSESISPGNMYLLEKQSMQFEKELNVNFTRMYYCSLNEFNKHYPQYAYNDMRANAAIVMMMVDCYTRHNEKMNALIKKKMPSRGEGIDMPTVVALRFLMAGYIGDCEIEYNSHMKTLIRVFENKLNSAEFEKGD